MAITLRGDNRQLTKNAQFSYLSNNYVSGVDSFVVTSVNRISVDDYLLFGEFGSEQSEILKVKTVTTATRTIVTTTDSAYPHAQDTKTTVLKYNQIRFYRDTVSTGATATALAAAQDIDADSLYSNYYDSINTTGYGFFLFYNETTATATTFSNPIPYTDFELYTVKKIFDSFFSLLNNSEQKLISDSDAFLWLNEAYARTTNSLNIVNSSYLAATADITVSANTAEYDLESDFSDIISITDSEGRVIKKLDINKVAQYRDSDVLGFINTQYYLIGASIGFVPTPTDSGTYISYYKKKSGTLDSLDDEIIFPDNQYFLLVDWMMFRAAQKLKYTNPQLYREQYTEEMQEFQITAHKQDNKLDTMYISPEANV